MPELMGSTTQQYVRGKPSEHGNSPTHVHVNEGPTRQDAQTINAHNTRRDFQLQMHSRNINVCILRLLG